MQLVPLKSIGILERMTCRNWLNQYVGQEDPNTWLMLEPTNTGMNNIPLTQAVNGAGLSYSIMFRRDEDAVAFKLRFAL